MVFMSRCIYFYIAEKNPTKFAQLSWGCSEMSILVLIVHSFVHRYKLLLEVSELKAELQKMSSAVPQEKEAQGRCKIQCFQVEEEPKIPQLLNSTKKVQITNTQVQQTKSVRKESVARKSDGKGNHQANYQRREYEDGNHKRPCCGTFVSLYSIQ